MNRLLRLLHLEADAVVEVPTTAGQGIDAELDAIRQEQAEQRAVVELLQQVAVARGWVTPDAIATVKKVDDAREHTAYPKPGSPDLAVPDHIGDIGQSANA